jgi:hypothetical protein
MGELGALFTYFNYAVFKYLCISSISLRFIVMEENGGVYLYIVIGQDGIFIYLL